MFAYSAKTEMFAQAELMLAEPEAERVMVPAELGMLLVDRMVQLFGQVLCLLEQAQQEFDLI
jgi:hypothetical protein